MVRLLVDPAVSSSNSSGTETLSTTFTRLATYVDTLCLSLLEDTEPPAVQVTPAILEFYELIANAASSSDHDNAVRLTLPSPHLVYLLLFTPSLSTLSRLCSILTMYKRGFEGTMAAAASRGKSGIYSREFVNHFNGLIMDICNCIWRNRALTKDDANALGCLVSASFLPALKTHVEALGYPLGSLFSLSHSTTLCALSIACFRDLEDAAGEAISVRHAGPLTQRSLAALADDGGLEIRWGEYRLEVLRWLDQRGVTGISELMHCTMRHLTGGSGKATSATAVTATQ